LTPYCSSRMYPFGLILMGALGLAACREEDAVTDPGAEAPLMAEASAAPAFATLAVGRYYTCGLTSEGRPFCWGNNDAGQLGDGSTTARLRPVPVAGGLAFRAITAGAGHTCGVTTNSRLYCWGNGRYVGITSPPVRTDGPVAVAPSLRFQNVYAGFSHTCAITEGDRRAYCWGAGFAGELGDGGTDYQATPVAVAGGRQWRQLSIGYEFSCGITTGRKGFCWGKDNEGQLGNDAASAKKLTPVAVADDHVFEQIDSDMLHTCAWTPQRRSGAGASASRGRSAMGGCSGGSPRARWRARASSGG
jgi:alpha-tubulin suppressor-like RCC1 family protein